MTLTEYGPCDVGGSPTARPRRRPTDGSTAPRDSTPWEGPVIGVFLAALLGAVVGSLGTGVVTWIAQNRAWEHESSVHAEERRLAVMPFITFKVVQPPVINGTVEGKRTFVRLPLVIARNVGSGPARFAPVDVLESFKDAIQRQPVPAKGLTLLDLPVHLNAGEQCDISMVLKDVSGLEKPGGTNHEFWFWDLYGNRYTSAICAFRVMNQKGIDEWLLSTDPPHVTNVGAPRRTWNLLGARWTRSNHVARPRS